MKARLVAAAVIAGLLGASPTADAQIEIVAILSISGTIAAMGLGYKAAFDCSRTNSPGRGRII